MRQIAVTLAILLSAGVAMGLLLYLRNTPAPVVEKNAVPDRDRSGHDVQVGDSLIVGNADSEDREQTICMVRDLEDADAVRIMVEKRDHEGMRQFLGRRRASLIHNRTPATLLELGPTFCRVRIDKGENRGREGWISAEFLLREAP